MDGIFFAFSMAFSNVSHNPVVYRLRMYGLDGWTSTLVKNCLDNRFESRDLWVVLRNLWSTTRIFNFLYDIFINDLKKAIEHTILGIADATKLDWGRGKQSIYSGKELLFRDPGRLENRDSRDHEELNKDM